MYIASTRCSQAIIRDCTEYFALWTQYGWTCLRTDPCHCHIIPGKYKDMLIVEDLLLIHEGDGFSVHYSSIPTIPTIFWLSYVNPLPTYHNRIKISLCNIWLNLRMTTIRIIKLCLCISSIYYIRPFMHGSLIAQPFQTKKCHRIKTALWSTSPNALPSYVSLESPRSNTWSGILYRYLQIVSTNNAILSIIPAFTMMPSMTTSRSRSIYPTTKNAKGKYTNTNLGNGMLTLTR